MRHLPSAQIDVRVERDFVLMLPSKFLFQFKGVFRLNPSLKADVRDVIQQRAAFDIFLSCKELHSLIS